MRLNRHLQKLRIPQLKNSKVSRNECNTYSASDRLSIRMQRNYRGNIFFELMALSFGCGKRADNIRLVCKFDDSIYSNQMNFRRKKNGSSSGKKKELCSVDGVTILYLHGVCVQGRCIYEKNRNTTRRQGWLFGQRWGNFPPRPSISVTDLCLESCGGILINVWLTEVLPW